MRLFLRCFWILLLFLLIGRVFYRFVLKNESTLNGDDESNTKEQTFNKASRSSHPATVSYDFKKLIKLLDTSAQIKKTASPSFEQEDKLPILSRSTVEELLKELLRERVKLRNYILDLKGYSTMGVPIRKYRSLLYYLEILEHNISDMRTLLKKGELFQKP